MEPREGRLSLKYELKKYRIYYTLCQSNKPSTIFVRQLLVYMNQVFLHLSKYFTILLRFSTSLI